VIHSDFETSFISAETISYDDMVSCGSFAKARELGILRTEGKEYVVQDGDLWISRPFFKGSLTRSEGVAGRHPAFFQAASEPLHALCGRSVRE
jgi:hypothetical protein